MCCMSPGVEEALAIFILSSLKTCGMCVAGKRQSVDHTVVIEDDEQFSRNSEVHVEANRWMGRAQEPGGHGEHHTWLCNPLSLLLIWEALFMPAGAYGKKTGGGGKWQ